MFGVRVKGFFLSFLLVLLFGFCVAANATVEISFYEALESHDRSSWLLIDGISDEVESFSPYLVQGQIGDFSFDGESLSFYKGYKDTNIQHSNSISEENTSQVPIPGALLLFGTGLFTLGCMRRSNKK